jgi:hypothetical protein
VLEINYLQSYEDLPDIEEFDDQTPATQIQENFSSPAWYGDVVSYLLTL